jgi:hypothetical protein
MTYTATVLLPPHYGEQKLTLSLDDAYRHYAEACGLAVGALTAADKRNALADALISTCAQIIQDEGEAQ